MIHSTKLGIAQPKMSFGILSAFAVREGYSVSYYKRTLAKKLNRLGRLANTQGKPALRCDEGFSISARNIARSLTDGLGELRDEGVDTFMLDQRGHVVHPDWELKPDFVRFVIQRNYIYVTAVSLSGYAYNVDDAVMIALGGV